MRTEFGAANTESDVEKQFIYPLLTLDSGLAIPESAVFTQESIRAYEINKGAARKLYKPDFVIYCEGIPVLIVEAKDPESDATIGFAEAQLYAHQINNEFEEGVNPVKYVIATNGREIIAGPWDKRRASVSSTTQKLAVGSSILAEFIELCGWARLQKHALEIKALNTSRDWHMPSEFLGENRVLLSKVGHNSLYADLDPLLRRYFNPTDEASEEEIVRRAYVASDEVTKYQKTFETYLKSRIVPLNEVQGLEIKTSKRSAPDFSSRMNRAATRATPQFMQLIIGGVGSGKTTFLKRYFRHLIPVEIDCQTAFCRIDINEAPDDLSGLNDWLCKHFIERLRERYPNLIDTETPEGLRSIFSNEIKDNRGAYQLLRQASEKSYNERLATDLLAWMGNAPTFAKAVARMVSGDMGQHLVVALDNVDRRDREAQLSIFQTGQWFMNLTRATILMTLRDETYEAYRNEKPLDAFPKTGNFYIRPPRFIDMVAKRLDLAIEHITDGSKSLREYDVPGLGVVRYPDTALGNYLTAVYTDLFRRKRNITLVLEALAGKNARRALEMLTAVLTSAHFDTRDFTSLILAHGSHRIQESTLLKSLMRTNYLYFTSSHGFVKNIFDFPTGCKQPSHFLKSEVLTFLTNHRKKIGDINLEGYYTVSYLESLLGNLGYDQHDVRLTIDTLLKDELIISDNLTKLEVNGDTAVRIHPSGYIHMHILAQRLEYIASAALVTPCSDRGTAETIGRMWHINSPHIDIRPARKREVAERFLQYLKTHQRERRARSAAIVEGEMAAHALIRGIQNALSGNTGVKVDEAKEFEQLFEQS